MAVRRFEATAQIANTPDYVVEQGEIFRTLAGLGGTLNTRLKRLADDAAAREGDLAGLSAGQRAGVGYVAQRSAEGAAAGEAGYDLTPHLTDPSRAPHLEGIKPEFRSRLAQMIAAAPEDMRSQIQLLSGYRSEDRQAQLYTAALAKYGSEAEARKWVAPPGKSRHQHGDAYDLRYGSDAAKAWVHANAGKFGLAFPLSNEPWHIEMVEARGGGAPAAGVPAVATGGLNPQPLALRNDGTIRGEAFDQAAVNAYSWRMAAGLTNDMGAAYEQFKDDPAGFASATGEIHDRYLADDSFDDPRLREAFERTFSEKRVAYGLDIAARQEARLMAEQSAAVDEGLASMQRDLERQAYLLGANPDGEQILAAQGDRIIAAIDGAVEANVLPPAQGVARKEAIASSVATGRIQGVFAALATPAQKEAYATGLMDEWAKGEGALANLDFNQVKALSSTLYAQARAEQNQLTAEAKAEQGRLKSLIADDVASMASTGQGLDTSANLIDPARVEALLGPEGVADWQAEREFARRQWEATAGMEVETPAEINDRLAALEPVPGSEGFRDQSAVHAVALERAAEVLKQREIDPLGQAAGAGAVELVPIDTSSGDALTQSLADRRLAAQQVSDMYATPLTVFRPGERAALASALLDNPGMLPAFALAVTDVFGADAPQALTELSEAGPELAHVAGVAMATGDVSLAEDIARVITGRRDKTLNVKLPSDAVMTAAAGAVLGPAMSQNQPTRAAVVNVATMLFEQQAAAMGFDPADIKEPDSAAFAAYSQAVDRALGAHVINGVKYGGLGEVNGLPIVAPSDMPAERVGDMLRSLSAEDLAALPPIASGNGVPIEPWDLHGARLVTVGDGQYRVALGDPYGLDPRWLTTPDGDYWVFDAPALELERAQRPPPSNGILDWARESTSPW